MWPTMILVLLAAAEQPFYEAELVFPLHDQHNHAPGVVECPNGDLLVSWYRGSGERTADDVLVLGARKRKGESTWSDPFLLVDTPEFPDCNTAMLIDRENRLWLFWPVIVANSWESAITLYRRSSNYEGEGAPIWDWQGMILCKPRDFLEQFDAAVEREKERRPKMGLLEAAFVAKMRPLAKDKLLQRLGWQPRHKPVILPSGRIVFPLYSDTYSACIMALSDDGGETWQTSEPLIGFGNIQPTILFRKDGSLVAYMRENGPLNRIRVSESTDEGMTWSPVGESELPNPGAGTDGVNLANGNWVLVYNDQTKGRNRLAVSLSEDEGKTWSHTRHLELEEAGAYHYPVVIQGKDGTIHAVYSFFAPKGGKSMKHAAFNEAWIRAGDPPADGS